MGRNGTTVREAAQHAGVSIATVSRVVRGVGQIAPETRQRVLAAVEELGYRPCHLGRALSERRHHALGIVFPGFSGPYYSEVIHGFEDEALAAHQRPTRTHHLRHSGDLVMEMAARVDGLAVCGGTLDAAMFHRLLAERVPTVILGGHSTSPKVQISHIPGRPPDMSKPPPGCPFHQRCPDAIARCQVDNPALVALGNGKVACHVALMKAQAGQTLREWATIAREEQAGRVFVERSPTGAPAETEDVVLRFDHVGKTFNGGGG